MTRLRTAPAPGHRPVPLLAAQAFALGLMMTWTLIPASAIFLEAYGSDLLPVTYIGAAFAGIAASTLLARALRSRPLASVATLTLAVATSALFASWLVLATAHVDAVSFGLLVVVPIVVPVGFIFVVGQAGMLLDVRALKASYAQVVAGFALGCAVGGLGGGPLLTLLGTTESLVAAAAVAAAAFLLLVETARHRYPAELAAVESAAGTPRPTLRALVGHRFVLLIVAFQMLSALESQWLDFHVFASAAQRYESNEALARFVSQFSAIAYGTDILFLVVIAGFLLHRFGLRYGLVANSAGVLALVAAVILATVVTGAGTTIVFVLVVAARVTDLTLSDGASRTSLSAAYQAVPTRARALAQATIEGLAVPVAIGLSGVVLLVLDQVGGTEGLAVPIVTAVVVAAWVVVGALLYRAYRVSLLANLRGRTLDPAELLVGDEGLPVVDRLIDSADERDVRLGLDLLTAAERPELAGVLRRLSSDDRVDVRTDALTRLVDVAPLDAAAAARGGLDSPSPTVRAASLRVLGRVGRPEDLADLESHWSDPDAAVRVAAAYAMTRVGDDRVRAEVAARIAGLIRSPVTGDRVDAARMVSEVTPVPPAATVSVLLADQEPAVVNAGLDALRYPEHADLLATAVTRLATRTTAAAAVDALVRAGELALGVVARGLGDPESSRATREHLVRVARQVGGPSATRLLRACVGDPDRDLGLAAMLALATPGRAGPAASRAADAAPDESDPGHAPTAAVVHDDLEHATRIVGALVTLADDPAATVLDSALRDELELVRRRVLAALALRHGSESIQRVAMQLAQEDPRSHALALEWLDVTLTGADRGAVAVLEPHATDRDRLTALGRRFGVARPGRHELLVDLAIDGDDVWRRPWLAACSLYVAARGSETEFAAVASAASSRTAGYDDPELSVVGETLADVVAAR